MFYRSRISIFDGYKAYKKQNIVNFLTIQFVVLHFNKPITVKSFFITSLFFFIFIGSNDLYAQKVMKNSQGEVIVKYEDGSWRYYDPKDRDDIQLLEDQNRRVRARNEEKKRRLKESHAEIKEVKPKSKSKSKPKLSLGSKSKSNKQSNNKALAKAKKPKKKKTKTKSSKDRDPNKAYVGQNYREEIKRIIIQTRDEKIKVSDKERKALFQKNALSDKIAVAKKQNQGKMKIKSLENKLAITKLDLKEAGKRSKQLTKKRKAYSKILNEDPQIQAVMYNKLARKFGTPGQLKTEAYATTDPTYDHPQVKEKKKSGKLKNIKIGRPSLPVKGKKSAPQATSYTGVQWPQRMDLIKNPPKPDCTVAFQGVDSFSGKKRKDLAPRNFFSHTDPRMAKFFTDKDMLECKAYLSALAGGNVYLSLNIVISTETAKTSYGAIERGSLLSLKMVNGENINMTNNQTDPGFLDPIAKTTSYKVTYLIPTQHVKALQKNEIDLVRVVWETGYEDYEIFETDFIIEQMNCLQQ